MKNEGTRQVILVAVDKKTTQVKLDKNLDFFFFLAHTAKNSRVLL
jgi:hypothetical protein